MTALNPIDTVGEQIAEVIRLHAKINKKEAALRAVEILEMSAFPATAVPNIRTNFPAE